MQKMKRSKSNKTNKTNKFKKHLESSFEDFVQSKPLSCPLCNSNKNVIKYGTRNVKSESIQVFLCKDCNHRFTNRPIQNFPYPTPIILQALTYFNLGHTLQQTQTTMQRKHKTKIPISTLNNWINRFEDGLSFIRLRKNYNINPLCINLPEGHPSGS